MPRSRIAARVGSILVAILVLGWLYLGLRLESWINVVAPVRLPDVGPRAEALHGTSFVADLHSDSLLFGRDLLERSSMGHVDLPRLQEGGVALQIFALPTIVPFGLNIESNTGDGFDSLTFAGAIQLSPTALLGPTGRALHAADRLADFVAASDGEFVQIRTRADLAALQDARAAGADVTGAMLAIEGAHALEGGLGLPDDEVEARLLLEGGVGDDRGDLDDDGARAFIAPVVHEARAFSRGGNFGHGFQPVP